MPVRQTRRSFWKSSALVACLLLASACGSSADSPAEAATQPSEVVALDLEALAADGFVPITTATMDPATLSFVDDVVERYGAERAFQAVVGALARGYSIAQVRDAISSEELDEAGHIMAVDPSLAASQIVSLSNDDEDEVGADIGRGSTLDTSTVGPVRLALKRQSQKVELASLLDVMQDVAFEKPEPGIAAGEHFLGIVVSLAESGYSLDQIVAELIAGNTAFFQRETTLDERPSCAVLIELGSDGPRSIVRPAGATTQCRSDVESAADGVDRLVASRDGDATESPDDPAEQPASDIVTYSTSALGLFGVSSIDASVAYIDALPADTADVRMLVYRDNLRATVGDTLSFDIELLFAGFDGFAEELAEDGSVQLDGACTYLRIVPDAPLVQLDGDDFFSGTALISGGYAAGLEVTCDVVPPIEVNNNPTPVTASIVGDQLEITISATEGGEDLSATLTRDN